MEYNTIIVKGLPKGIVVPKDVGDKVWEAVKKYQTSREDSVIDIEPYYKGFASGIRAVHGGVTQEELENHKDKLRDSKMEDGEKVYKKINADKLAETKRYLEGTLEQKITYNLKIANLVCYAQTGEWLYIYPSQVGLPYTKWQVTNPEIHTAVVELIKQELQKSKLVDPVLYRHLFQVVDETSTAFSNNSPKINTRVSTFRILESMTAEIMSNIRQLGYIPLKTVKTAP